LALAVDKAEHPPAPLPRLLFGGYWGVARPDGHVVFSSDPGDMIVGSLRAIWYAGDSFHPLSAERRALAAAAMECGVEVGSDCLYSA